MLNCVQKSRKKTYWLSLGLELESLEMSGSFVIFFHVVIPFDLFLLCILFHCRFSSFAHTLHFGAFTCMENRTTTPTTLAKTQSTDQIPKNWSNKITGRSGLVLEKAFRWLILDGCRWLWISVQCLPYRPVNAITFNLFYLFLRGQFSPSTVPICWLSLFLSIESTLSSSSSFFIGRSPYVCNSIIFSWNNRSGTIFLFKNQHENSFIHSFRSRFFFFIFFFAEKSNEIKTHSARNNAIGFSDELVSERNSTKIMKWINEWMIKTNSKRCDYLLALRVCPILRFKKFHFGLRTEFDVWWQMKYKLVDCMRYSLHKIDRQHKAWETLAL